MIVLPCFCITTIDFAFLATIVDEAEPLMFIQQNGRTNILIEFLTLIDFAPLTAIIDEAESLMVIQIHGETIIFMEFLSR
jgi:hypothetical protein